jgi:1,4-alpha-glucan branching enzyme
MSDLSPRTPVIERGMALHKMIRLISHGLGGEGYLNFMGNEFGHPEWLDFPREGNDSRYISIYNSSFHYARRQYNLIDDEMLRYKYLYAFDKAMQHLHLQYRWSESTQFVSLKHEEDKIIAFERGNLLWIFNFHSSKSFTDYRIGTPWSGVHRIVLNTDDEEFFGLGRVEKECEYHPTREEWCGRENYVMVYVPCRTAIVLRHD